MSRRVDQVTRLEAFAGFAVILVVVAAVIALCNWLLLPAGHALPAEPPTQGPPLAPGEVRCPLTLHAAPSQPLQVTASQLIECPDVHNGQFVAYQGEVVGAVLRRGPRAWVQLNDDPYALTLGPLPQHRTTVGANSGMAVSIPVAAADGIRNVGGHDRRGDVLAVTGRFRRADPDDGGGPTIRADTVAVTRRGAPVRQPLSAPRLAVAGMMAVATTAVGAVVLRARRP